jgi:hypothetical protein
MEKNKAPGFKPVVRGIPNSLTALLPGILLAIGTAIVILLLRALGYVI